MGATPSGGRSTQFTCSLPLSNSITISLCSAPAKAELINWLSIKLLSDFKSFSRLFAADSGLGQQPATSKSSNYCPAVRNCLSVTKTNKILSLVFLVRVLDVLGSNLYLTQTILPEVYRDYPQMAY